jgi:competence protein ComEA
MVLCFICLLLAVIRIVYPAFIEPDESIVVKDLPLVELKNGVMNSENNSPGHNISSHSLFAFNPNTVTKQQLLDLGFHKRTAETFIKFRSRGFTFKQKEDLKKVYGVDDDFYTRLLPYIILDQKNLSTARQETTPQKKSIVVDLNSADSMTLVSLKGIGPSFTKRILKYRSLLGGFSSPQQLMEVYGFNQEMYDLVKPNVEVKAAVLVKININTDDFKTINRHPYIGYEITKLIFAARKQQALTENSLEQIVGDKNLYAKLLPYINFNK